MHNAALVTYLIFLLKYVYVYEINLDKQSSKGRKLPKRLKSNNFEIFIDYLSAKGFFIMVRITNSSVRKLLSTQDEYVRQREQ